MRAPPFARRLPGSTPRGGNHAVVATGRDATKVAAAVGEHDNLLAVKLEVTRPQDAEAAVEGAVAKFGRIDDLAKLAAALVMLVGLKEPPARFAAGADAVQTFEAKANTLLAQAQAHRELSASLAYDVA